MSNESHVEFEHKYVVDQLEAADVVAAAERKAPGLARYSYEAQGSDVYYAAERVPERVLRFRSELLVRGFWRNPRDTRRELSIKSLGGDIERRLEVDLHLEHGFDQTKGVDAFASALGFNSTRLLVEKRSHVWTFDECEVCVYEAVGPAAKFLCVEFEALRFTDDCDAARALLERWETAFGFSGRVRERRSLFEMMSATTNDSTFSPRKKM